MDWLRICFYRLLLPGGSVEFSSSIGTKGYADTANFLIKLAKQANDKGDYFPIWGACLGFEFLIFHEANNKNILTACNAWNVQNKLKFTKGLLENTCHMISILLQHSKSIASCLYFRCNWKQTIQPSTQVHREHFGNSRCNSELSSLVPHSRQLHSNGRRHELH